MKPDREDGVGITLGVQEGSMPHAFMINKPGRGDVCVNLFKKNYKGMIFMHQAGGDGGASAAPGT